MASVKGIQQQGSRELTGTILSRSGGDACFFDIYAWKSLLKICFGKIVEIKCKVHPFRERQGSAFFYICPSFIFGERVVVRNAYIHTGIYGLMYFMYLIISVPQSWQRV